MNLVFHLCLIYRKLETCINISRLVYDPINRPGIHRDCKTPAMADWKILKLNEPPPPGWKAGDWKEHLKRGGSLPEEIVDVDDDEEEKEVEEVPRPKRQRKSPTNYSDAATAPAAKAAKPKEKRTKQQSKEATNSACDSGSLNTANPGRGTKKAAPTSIINLPESDDDIIIDVDNSQVFTI